MSLKGKGLTAVDGAMALIIVLLMTQMWILAASLESFLSGHQETAIAGMLLSGLILLANIGLYLFILRLDADLRRDQ